ncbi:MAG: septum formation protein Maf [Lachnospiraceae bacterium]|nr:septum formation protein Maf [Lachnospiraceae bacterium]
MIPVILASGSPRRKELLGHFGIEFEIRPSEKEEVIATDDPVEAVKSLAKQKAEDIFSQTTGDCIVIGADTVVANEGKILGKPKDEEDAKRMIRSLSGHAHQVCTGVMLLIRQGEDVRRRNFAVETNVHVHELTEDQIARYVAKNESLDKAGAYAMQGWFAPFIDGIEGDYFNVVGLPIARLYEELLTEGIDLYQ